MEKNDKQRAIEAAIAQITKKQGAGSIMRLGAGTSITIDAISTGSFALDIATGVKGFPRGRIIEVYGPESSGKTTIALSAIAQTQRDGGTAAFIDAEHALDPPYARQIGVHLGDLLVSQPSSGEEALEITEMLTRSGAIDILVIDSVAALVPKAEIEGDMGASLPGLQARLMSQAMRKLTAAVAKSGTCIIFINQLRMKIGVMFGNPETTTGGNALKFYASLRLDVRRGESIKDKEGTVIGGEIKVKVVKNKVAPPFKSAILSLFYKTGISKEADIVGLALQMKIIEKSGAWYSFEGSNIGQGADNAREFLVAHPDMAKKIVSLIMGTELPVSEEAKAAAEEVTAAEKSSGHVSQHEEEAACSGKG